MDDERQVAALTAQSVGEACLSMALLLKNLEGTVYRRINYEATSMQFVSSGVEELTGHPPAVFTGQVSPVAWTEIIHPDDRATVAAKSEGGDHTVAPVSAHLPNSHHWRGNKVGLGTRVTHLR